MGRNIEEVLNSLPPERREKIERRSAELLAEYKTRQKLKEILETSEELGINEQLMMLPLMLRLLRNFKLNGVDISPINPEDINAPVLRLNLSASLLIVGVKGKDYYQNMRAELDCEDDLKPSEFAIFSEEIRNAISQKDRSLTAPRKVKLSVLCDLVEELKGSLEVVVNLPGKSPVRLPIAIQEEMMSETNVITNTPPEPPVSHALSGLLPEFLQEIQQTPKEYWPNLLQIIRLFRESVNGENLAKIFTEMSEEERIKRNQAVIELINSWVEEGDEQEQTETAEYLRQVLD